MKEAFHVGQLVRITRPATGYADHRIYCIEPRRDCRRLPLLRVRSHHDETERQYLFT